MISNICSVSVKPSVLKSIRKDPDHSDIPEISKMLEYFGLLCDYDREMQNEFTNQHHRPGSVSSLPSLSYLMNIFVYMVDDDFGQELVHSLIKLMFSLINGNNIEVINSFLTLRILEGIQQIVNLGYYKGGVYHCPKLQIGSNDNILDQANDSGDDDKKDEEDDSDEDQEEEPFNNNKKIVEIKRAAMNLLVNMINEDTKAEIRSQLNMNWLKSIVMVSYAQVLQFSGGRYIDDYVNPESNVRKHFDIRVAFYAFYCLRELDETDANTEFNIIQEYDVETRFSEYMTLLKNWKFSFAFWKNKTPLPTQKEIDERVNPENTEEFLEEAITYFDAHSSHIEIYIEGLGIRTKYFEINPDYLAFPQDEKDKFWEIADLSDCKTYCRSLFDYAIEKTRDLELQHEIQKQWFCLQSVAQRSNWLTDILKFLIVIMNIFIFIGYGTSDGKDRNEPDVFSSVVTTQLIMYIVGGLILAGLIYFTVIQFIIATSKTLYLFKDDFYDEEISLFRKIKLVVFFPVEIIQRRDIWCLIPCVAFAITGLAVSFYYFVGCLIMIIIYSPEIMQIVNAVWEPRNRIGVTLLLTGIVIYVYAVFAFASFHEDFNSNIDDSCNNIYSCMVVILDQWYKNDLGGFLDESAPSLANSDGEYNPNWYRIMYDMLFFILVPLLLVNILAGIIIDNFGERRALTDSIKTNQQAQCYICGIPHSDIENFSSHVNFLHNAWDYMYYIGYLITVHPSELTNSPDIYIKNLILKDSIKWFPCYAEENETSSTEQGLDDMKNLMAKNNDDLTRRVENIEETDKKLIEKVDNLTKLVEKLSANSEPKAAENKAPAAT